MIWFGAFVHCLHLGSVDKSLDALNHVTVGAGSPTISKVQNTFSPSVEENLSDGLMNLHSFPLPTSGVEVLSQSQLTSDSLSPGFRDFFRAGPAPRAIFRAGVEDGECCYGSPGALPHPSSVLRIKELEIEQQEVF